MPKMVELGMSGHSKWSTIKRQKGVNDAKRGQLFSKLTRAITLAAKQGGPSSDANLRLKLAIDQARSSNMPKENIERAVANATTSAGSLQEVLYEGYGPYGVAILVETATDNKNRTAQEMKNAFEKSGGSLGSPGSVAFQFEQKGLISLLKGDDPQATMLKVIDAGVEDIIETPNDIEVYTTPGELSGTRDKIEKLGLAVSSVELTFKPKSTVPLSDKETEKILTFLEILDGHEDVQRVFANINFP